MHKDKIMDLILWRHAEAVEVAAGHPDLKRRLTARGEKQARHVARWLRDQQLRHLRILVSPAVRCQQTAHPLAIRFETDSRLAPTASVDDLLAAANWPDGSGTVLLVGHQPVLGQLAATLLTGQPLDWAIRKGVLWWFSRRVREGEPRIVLRAVVDPEMI